MSHKKTYIGYMKKVILILLFLLSLNNTFASSKKYTSEEFYKAAKGAFKGAIDSDSIEERTKFENGLLRFCKEVPELKEQVIKVYNEKKIEYEEQHKTAARARLIQIGNKLGIE